MSAIFACAHAKIEEQSSANLGSLARCTGTGMNIAFSLFLAHLKFGTAEAVLAALHSTTHVIT